MRRLSALILVIFVLFPSLLVLADGPVLFSGTTVKWIPSGLKSAGVCKLDASGVMTSGTVGTSNLDADSVTDAILRESAGLSVIGRSANTTGNPADITAASDYNILRRSGTSLGFGSIDLSQSGAVGSSVLTVPNGGTGATTFTANLPLIGNTTGAIAQGTRSGNTTSFATTSGTLTSGNCVQFDASGNIVDSGAACGGGSGWSLSGNAGTTAGTDFVGTTDAQDVVIKRNSTEIARATSTGWQASTVQGSSSSGGDLNLSSTSNATKGQIVMPDVVQVGSSSNTTSALSVRQNSDALAASGISMQSTDGTRNLHLNLQNNRDWYINDGATYYLNWSQANSSLYSGQTGGRFAIEKNFADITTNITTPTISAAAMGVVNTSATNGNYSGYYFKGNVASNNPGAGIISVNDAHGASASATLAFLTRNSGTYARRMNIASDGQVTMDAYGAGVAHFSSAGLISSSTIATGDIAANAVTDAKLRQSAGLSVIGRSANSTGDVADITAGSDYNILRRSGTSIGFGSIDLSQSGAVGSSVLPVANGGTGQSSYTNGQLLIGNTTGNTLTKATLTAGTGITITNGNGSITIASSGAASSGQMKAFWQGYHDDDCNWSTTTTGSWTNFGDSTCTFVDSGPESTSFPAVSTVTDGGSTEYPGITFTTAMAGVYEVCALYETTGTAAAYYAISLYDQTNGIRSSHVNRRSNTTVVSDVVEQCGMFTYASGVTFDVRLMGYLDGANTVYVGYSSGSFAGAQQTIQWSVKVYEQ